MLTFWLPKDLFLLTILNRFLPADETGTILDFRELC